MNVGIERLSEADLQSIDDLSRSYRNTLGFLTIETFRDYLSRGRVLGARTAAGKLTGYLLFADYPDRFRIAQLCVSDEYRGQGIARRLVDELKATATTQKVIKLRCRRDFAAHEMWKKLGFIPLDEKPGRSAQGHLLTLWCYRIAHDDELGLWKAETSDEILDIVIDAQIFYDFDATETPNAIISKGLLNDFLIDSLNLWITDELFLEINRQKSDELRKRSMERAHGMARLPHRQDQTTHYREILKSVLPYRSPSEQSDIHHLAKTAASDVKTFATKDERLLEKSTEIKSLTGISVIHPAEIITSLHEIIERQSYSPTRVTGLELQWRRMRGEDCADLPDGAFQKHGESKGKLIETIRSFLSHPNRYRCEFLQANSKVMAIRALDTAERGRVVIPLARVSGSSDTKLFGDFLVADTLSLSVEANIEMVRFPTKGSSECLGPSLINMGFKAYQESWVKIVLAQSCCRNDAQTRISSYIPELDSEYQKLGALDFERDCAPLASNEAMPVFLIPIRPAFAMGLIDRRQAANDLFGGNPSVLLRWDNVYYRKKSRHKMIQAPGRILWYASGDIGEIVAVSHLDGVDVGLPKDLFRRHQKFGVLEWRDIYSMCERDVDQEIMAILFSRTFLFKRRISLDSMRAVFAEEGIAESLQSPSKIPFKTFQKLFQIGFPIQS